MQTNSLSLVKMLYANSSLFALRHGSLDRAEGGDVMVQHHKASKDERVYEPVSLSSAEIKVQLLLTISDSVCI